MKGVHQKGEGVWLTYFLSCGGGVRTIQFLRGEKLEPSLVWEELAKEGGLAKGGASTGEARKKGVERELSRKGGGKVAKRLSKNLEKTMYALGSK